MKPFDIRALFAESIDADTNDDEQRVYAAIDRRRRRRPLPDVLDTADLAVLGSIDVERTTSNVHLPVYSERRASEDVEEPADNREWKIHVLKGLLHRDWTNVDARIRLSRVLEGDKARRILLEGADMQDAAIWRELVDRHYTPDMLSRALDVRNGDEDFYESLFSRDGNAEALRAGVERHPGSTRLRLAFARTLEGRKKTAFLHESVLRVDADVLVDAFVESAPEPEEVFSLYTSVRERHPAALLVHLLENTSLDVLGDLFDTGLDRALQVLSRTSRIVNIPQRLLDRESVLECIRRLEIRPMTPLPAHLHSLFTSVARCGHEDTTLLACYGVAKQHVLDTDFVNQFFVMSPKKYFVDLLKARECWRLFVLTRDIKLFRKADRLLLDGIERYRGEAKTFVLARAKMYSSMGDFHTAYSAIPAKMRTIKRYEILAQISMQEALRALEQDLFGYKHHLLLAELRMGSGLSPDDVYERCMDMYPDNAAVALAYLRHLKRTSLERALELSDRLVKQFGSNEDVWFERFVVFRKLGKVSLSVLYNSRRHVRSQRIESEIRYYENKELPEGNACANYFTYKRVRIRECNRSGMCSRCTEDLQTHYRETILRHQDNGDNYLLYHCVAGLDDELARMIAFFDPRGGRYWVRVRKIRNMQTRLEEGCALLDLDLLN